MKKQRLNNLLGALALSLNDRIEEAITQETGLHGSIIYALILLSQAKALTIDALAKQLLLVHSSAVRLAERMTQEGLVAREAGEDKRTVVLALTALGREMAQSVLTARERAIEQVTDALTSEQCSQLIPICEKLIGVLSDNALNAIRVCRLCDEAACDLRDCPSELAYKHFISQLDPKTTH